MSPHPNGPPGRVPPEEWLNVFALVTYIPAPLGEFLDELRRELVPHDDPRAHVSLLPPRPLAGDWRQAWAEVRNTLERRASFEVELTGIRTFPVTDVIYLEVGAGARELCDIHTAMNSNSLAFHEPFDITRTSPSRRISRTRTCRTRSSWPSGAGANSAASAVSAPSVPCSCRAPSATAGSIWCEIS